MPRKPKPIDKLSKTARIASKRTAENLTPERKIQRDRFISALLLGRSRYEAAIVAGSAKRSAFRNASAWLVEPYVIDELRRRRESMNQDEIISRNEILLNLKELALEPIYGGQVRVQASMGLARITGAEEPQKHEHNIKGGVMRIPFMQSIDEWEKAARASQQQLKDTAED